MTEPLPTDALKRLAAVVPDELRPRDHWPKQYTYQRLSLTLDGEEQFGQRIALNQILINSIIAHALLPWVAVPCGEEVVLVRIERRTPTMGSPWSVPYWYCEGAESMGRVVNTAMDYTGATRFPDPLTALESIKKP